MRLGNKEGHPSLLCNKEVKEIGQGVRLCNKEGDSVVMT